MSDLQSEKINIKYKCSIICVCTITLQNFIIKIQKSNRNNNISNISELPFDVMCSSLEKDVDDTVPNEPTFYRFF